MLVLLTLSLYAVAVLLYPSLIMSPCFRILFPFFFFLLWFLLYFWVIEWLLIQPPQPLAMPPIFPLHGDSLLLCM